MFIHWEACKSIGLFTTNVIACHKDKDRCEYWITKRGCEMDVQPNCKIEVVENSDCTIILFLSLSHRELKSFLLRKINSFSFLFYKKNMLHQIKKQCVEWKIKTIFTSIIVF